MRKKISNLRLAIIFVVMLVLVLFLFLQKGEHNQSSFKRQLVEFAFDDVDRMELLPKSVAGESIVLKKVDDSWQIDNDNTNDKANTRMIDKMVHSIHDLKVKSMVANSEDRWKTYEVTDSLASRVLLYDGSKKVADVYIGKFKYVQPQSMSTYVRINGSKETYRVEGYLSGDFNKKVNDLRDKTVVKDAMANWTKLTFDYLADSSFVLTRNHQEWMVDGVMADSAAVVGYINTLKSQNGRQIIDVDQLPEAAMYHLSIERENLDPIDLVVKQYGDKKILESSENKGVWFDDQSLINRVFVPKSKFRF